MSKPTSQEIIAKGDYLDPLFDPSSLLVPHLRSILQHHSVRFPTNANKSQLIKLFIDNIRVRSKELKRERNILDSTASDASEILDAETGEPIEPPSAARRSSRRTIRPSPAHSSSPPAKPVKSRRLSKRQVVEVHGSDSESGSNSDRTPRRTLPSKKPRSSLWEDNNPFQSGRDSSSGPRRSITPKSLKTPRTSLSHRVAAVEPQSISPLRHSEAPSVYSNHEDDQDMGYKLDNDDEIPDELAQARQVQHQNQRIANKLSAQPDHWRKSHGTNTTNQSLPLWLRVILGLLTALSLSVVTMYKNESKALGYCEPGTLTNSRVQKQHLMIEEIQQCRAKMHNATEPHDIQDPNCNSLSLLPIPHPTTCTPCPEFAKCSPMTLLCEPAYVLKPNHFSTIPFLAWLCDGLPGLGPVAFPPRCIPDVRRRKAIGATARNIESLLARVRGERICNATVDPSQPEEIKYGLSQDKLYSQAQKFKQSRTITKFDDIFNQALAELKTSGLVHVLPLTDKQTFLASIRSEMDFGCKSRVWLRASWQHWRMPFLYFTLAVGALLVARSKWTSQALERRRTKSLVEEALKTLQAQEAAHFIDPIQNPSASLSSLQLRDLIMQNEHSIPTRARIWQGVERVVEGNTNVRVNMEVMPTGDEGRMWTWIGASRDRRVKFIDDSSGRPVV